MLTDYVTRAADISEYFLRDPYDQLDLFRQQSNLLDNSKKEVVDKNVGGHQHRGRVTSTEEKDNSEDTSSFDHLNQLDNTEDLEDYYDYLYDIGALPERTTRSTSTTTKSSTIVAAKSKGGRDHKQRPRLSPRRGHLQVGADVLARVKKPAKSHRFSTSRSSISRQQQQSTTAVRDNIAVESTQKSQMRLDHRGGHGGQKKLQRSSPPMMQRKVDRILPGLDNVERLIPGSLKTVIEDSGKRIVKAVMQPINDFNQPRDTVIRETTFASSMGNMFGKYRTYFGYMAPTFAPDHITSYLVAQWTSTFAITIAWISVGYMFTSMGVGRSADEGRSSPQPWEQLIPDSATMATVFYDLSEAAQRWHDEL